MPSLCSFYHVFWRVFLAYITQASQTNAPTPIIDSKTNIRTEMNLKNLKKLNFPPFKKIPILNYVNLRKKILELISGRFSWKRKTKQRFEVTFYPAPVQNDMHHHQNGKENS